MPILLRPRCSRQATTMGTPIEKYLPPVLPQYSLVCVRKELLRADCEELQHFGIFRN